MSDTADGHASKAAKDADAVDEVTRNTKSQTTAASYTTTDHEVIRAWAQARGARPATVAATGGKDDAGILRLDFAGADDDEDGLSDVDWTPFFDTFEDRKLAFIYQEKTSDGSQSRFSKFVSRENAQ